MCVFYCIHIFSLSLTIMFLFVSFFLIFLFGVIQNALIWVDEAPELDAVVEKLLGGRPFIGIPFSSFFLPSSP
jgi:hypothetical protein